MAERLPRLEPSLMPDPALWNALVRRLRWLDGSNFHQGAAKASHLSLEAIDIVFELQQRGFQGSLFDAPPSGSVERAREQLGHLRSLDQ